MKNFIKNFSQFKRLNEEKEINSINHPNGYKPWDNSNDLYEDAESFEDLLDQIVDRLIENSRNGTLGGGDTIEAIDPSTKEYAKYPMLNIFFDDLTGEISVKVGVPFLTDEDEEEDEDDGWQWDRESIETLKNIVIRVKEIEPGVSVSYSGEDDYLKVYGPYTGFYELTGSISQYLINEIEDKNVDNQNITKSDLEDFDSSVSLDDEYDNQDGKIGDDEDLDLEF